MGRHSKMAADRRHRRAAGIPVQRRPGIGVVDAATKLVHQVSDEDLVAGRGRGQLQALCGALLQAASLVEPGQGYCAECAR